MLTLLAKVASAQLAAELPAIVPALSGCLCDAKLQVKVRPQCCTDGSQTQAGHTCKCQVRPSSGPLHSPPTDLQQTAAVCNRGNAFMVCRMRRWTA